MSQAINAVGDGVKTGIQNLAEYSNTANTAMSFIDVQYDKIQKILLQQHSHQY